MTSTTSLKAIRLTHHHIGVFFALTIFFFAITGGLQMFGLHETRRGSIYIPPAILVHLSQLHKKGTLYLQPRKAAPPAGGTVDQNWPKPCRGKPVRLYSGAEIEKAKKQKFRLKSHAADASVTGTGYLTFVDESHSG